MENKNGSTSRKGCLWALNPAKVDKMQEELHKWRRKDPVTIRRSMAKPGQSLRYPAWEIETKVYKRFFSTTFRFIKAGCLFYFSCRRSWPTTGRKTGKTQVCATVPQIRLINQTDPRLQPHRFNLYSSWASSSMPAHLPVTVCSPSASAAVLPPPCRHTPQQLIRPVLTLWTAACGWYPIIHWKPQLTGSWEDTACL